MSIRNGKLSTILERGGLGELCWIGEIFHTGHESKETYCLCLGNTNTRPSDDGKTVDTAHMQVYQHETELLNGVADFLNDHDIDVISTYNGNTFDWKYMDGRAVLAHFIQHCEDFEQFWSHVTVYHKHHLIYQDLQGQLVDLEEAKEYHEVTQKEYDEQLKDIHLGINETLGNGAIRSKREPMPKTVHHALWNIWPKEYEDTPKELKEQNQKEALAHAKKLYEYFHGQPPIHYHYMHRLRAKKGNLVYRSVGSKAMGENFFMYPDLARVHVDQLSYFKKSLFRLSEYKLNFVANHFLKVSKYDMPYKQLFADYASGDPEKRRNIADYCVQDCDLLRRLDQKTNVILTYIFLFKMTRTPLIDLSLRGQQIRVFNCLYKKAVSVNAIINSKRSHKILTEYQGATVLEPKPGLHGGPNTWVEVLDFQSLYPSIIIAMLLCMMNLVLPDDINYVLALEKAGKIPPLHRVKIDEKTTYYFSRNPNCIIASELKRLLNKRIGVKGVMKGHGKAKSKAQGKLNLLTLKYVHLKCSQARKEWTSQLEEMNLEEKEVKQIIRESAQYKRQYDELDMPIPELPSAEPVEPVEQVVQQPNLEPKLEPFLKLLIALDQWTKGLAKLEKWKELDPQEYERRVKQLEHEILERAHQYKMQDVLQLSIKIVMNSFYGFFGVKEGMMPGMQPIAVATTYYGRDYIQRTKRFLQNLFDTHPDYKDLHMDVVYGDTGMYIHSKTE